MYKLVILYYRVDDVAALDDFFATTHMRLMEQMPGLRRIEVSHVQGKPGGQSRFYMMVETYFDSRRALEDGLLSEPGAELMEALRPWAEEKLVAWFYADAQSEDKPAAIP